MIRFRVGPTTSDAAGGDVEIGGYLFPKRVRYAPAGGEGRPGHIEPNLVADFEIRDGVPDCVSLAVTVPRFGKAISSAYLKGLDIETMAVDAFMEQAHKPLPGGGFAFPAVGDEAAARAVRIRLRSQVAPHTTARERAAVADLDGFETVERTLHKRMREKNPRSDELLRAVARTYLENLSDAPTVAVRRWLGPDTSERTAQRRVNQARAAGLLPSDGRARPEEYRPFLDALDDRPERRGITPEEARKRFAYRRAPESGGDKG